MNTADPTPRIEVFASPDRVPANAWDLFDAGDHLFQGPSWWRTVVDHAVPSDRQASFLLVRLGERPAALFPLQCQESGRGIESLTTPYTCSYTPLVAPTLSPAERGAVFKAFGRFCRGTAVTRLDAMPAEWPWHADLERGAAAAGLIALRFAHFGNWHEPVGGLGWSGYLAARPGALRETIRRRLRRGEGLPNARFALFDRLDGVEAGIAAFEAVYARSWKEPEPFPRFNAALMRACSGLGTLRLGVWWVDEQPIAAQFWAVEHRTATVLKLAHDDARKALSPGTVLTAWMLRHLLDREGVAEVDFGRGDDAYKTGWAGYRRQRIGIALATPWRLGGLAAILRHGVGRLRVRLDRDHPARNVPAN